MNTRMSVIVYSFVRCLFVVAVLAPPVLGGSEPANATRDRGVPNVTVTMDGAEYSLRHEAGTAFHVTAHPITDLRALAVPDSPGWVATWEEALPSGGSTPYYAISLDGQHVARVRRTSYALKLRHGEFNPARTTPTVAASFAADQACHLHIVQFVTQPLDAYRAAVAELGGDVLQFLAHHAHIVRMTAEVREAVAALPFVRSVQPYHPAYRLEEFMLDNVDRADTLYPLQRYNIQVFRAGPAQKRAVADRIETLAGTVNRRDAGKYLVEATLTPGQLYQVARWDEVLFIDRWSPYEADMNNARASGGANTIETVAGFTGSGVRGEVFDIGFNLSHIDFASRPLIEHGSTGGDSHGASTSGICFGDGSGDPNARGLLPDGQGIVADSDFVGMTGGGRYNHTGQSVQAPYFAVFQTSSVGSARTTQYSTISSGTDAAIFDFDLLMCQSQSNAGDQMSRPQAWAKNIVSGGGAYHNNTLNTTDDCWCGGASIGPAQDGRIKPDLCAYYDSIRTTTDGSPTAYTSSFGGTSGATPIIAGHFGLFFEMWAAGTFGNPVSGGSVFSERAHASTAKAMMIHTATQYPFSGTGHDLTRVHQGWGRPDVGRMYDLRHRMFIVDETQVLTILSTFARPVTIVPAETALRATLVYADPEGTTSSSQHRINDLTLKVTSPSNVVYWGNNGLLGGNWSTSGGSPNTIDTVENVFIQNPEAGAWTIEVLADEINQDGHVETAQMDADFALIISCDFCNDCNENGVPDQFDIANGTSTDCNNNGMPDECEGDVCPPTPNPMIWAAPPAPVSTTELTMTATPAIDDTPPVEYFFFWWGDGSGGNSSGWLPSNTYNDNGLVANTVYTYQARARDSADPRNYGTYTFPPASAATHIETPAGLTFGTVTDTSIDLTVDGVFSNLSIGQSGLFVEMTPAEGSGANVWVQNQAVSVTGLTPGTGYTFSVKARNQDGTETPSVGPFIQSTSGGAVCALSGDLDGDGAVTGSDISGYLREKLGQPAEPGENPACADYGTGTLEGDTALFVGDLLS